MTSHSLTGSAAAGKHFPSVSGIKVTAPKSLKSIELSINDKRTGVNWERGNEKELQATFNPSLDVFESSSHEIALKLHYHRGRWPLWRKVEEIAIKSSELLSLGYHGDQRRDWKNSYDGVDVIICFSLGAAPQGRWVILAEENNLPLDKDSKLASTTEQLIQICPRFRVLVIGKSGVGKSSAINAAFHTDEAKVAHDIAGVSDINIEIIPPNNKYFVLHDSQGFEHGEGDNFATVKNFIEHRSAMPEVKDKIHAIWLCFGIPRAGGRIIETGIEEFFEMKTKTPIIAVFTQYDLLVSRLERSTTSTEDAKKEADSIVKKACIEPLETAAGTKVPNMAISTVKGYETTVSDLVELTQTLVEKNFSAEPSVISAIAQRANPGVNLKACIAVGRMKYWKCLVSSINFKERSLELCLDVIHEDIITVWNLNDPHMHLRSKEFKALIANLVDNLRQNDAPDPSKGISAGVSMARTIAVIVSAFGSAAAVPIVLPIAGCLVLAQWVYQVYQRSHDTLRRLMAYIVDLTLIMQNVFWFSAIYGVPVTCRLVKLAYVAYEESIVMPNVHRDIKEFVDKQTFLDRIQRDDALSKIVEVLTRNCIDTEEMFRLESDVKVVDFSQKDDESWDERKSP